jgi:hypothetical protein
MNYLTETLPSTRGQCGKACSIAMSNGWVVIILWLKVMICLSNRDLLAGADSGKLYSLPDAGHPMETFNFF